MFELDNECVDVLMKLPSELGVFLFLKVQMFLILECRFTRTRLRVSTTGFKLVIKRIKEGESRKTEDAQCVHI